MSEYIDREQLLELINEDCKYKKPTNEYTRGCNDVCEWAIKTIENIPTADVVPKSEVERWRRNLEAVIEEIPETKREVAREIFDDIANMMVLQHGFNEKHIVAHIDFELLKELKKKYIGE